MLAVRSPLFLILQYSDFFFFLSFNRVSTPMSLSGLQTHPYTHSHSNLSLLQIPCRLLFLLMVLFSLTQLGDVSWQRELSRRAFLGSGSRHWAKFHGDAWIKVLPFPLSFKSWRQRRIPTRRLLKGKSADRLLPRTSRTLLKRMNVVGYLHDTSEEKRCCWIQRETSRT